MSTIKKIFSSSLLLIADSLLKKLIGLVSTLILARLLIPEDFGLVAIATLTIGFMDIFAQTGSTQYLLRCNKISDQILNTAWSIDFIIRTTLSLILIAISPFITEYYSDTRLQLILIVLASMMFVQGFKNPALNKLSREQNYLPIVKLSVFTKFVSVIVAVSIAIIYETYWALILGQYTSTISMTIGSYLIYPYKPKFCFINSKKQWQFSGWVIPQSILGYIRTQIDTILVSSLFGKSELGNYHVMKYLAFIPSEHIILPATHPLLVELSKSKSDKFNFTKQYNITFIITLFIALPITFSMFGFSKTIIQVLLGEQWLKFSHLFALFSLLIPAYAMYIHSKRTLIAYSKTQSIFIYELIFSMILLLILFTIGLKDIVYFTWIKIYMENIFSFIFLFHVSIKYTSLRNFIKIIILIMPILISCFIAIFISTSYTLYALPLFILTVKMTIFLSIFLLSITLFHILFRYQFDEWKYIDNLLKKSYHHLLEKFK